MLFWLLTKAANHIALYNKYKTSLGKRSNMQYQTFDFMTRTSEQFSKMCAMGQELTSHSANPWANTWLGKTVAASFETAHRHTKRYPKQCFDITATQVDGIEVEVTEHIAQTKPFCKLLNFKRQSPNKALAKTISEQPKVLVVAALSGHFATLLKDTVATLMTDHDVYITDWADAREVPLTDGDFGFETYVSYLIDFMHELGPNAHIVAVCQPTVQSLIATAVMSQAKDPCTPKSLTLMAGPIDTRVNPNKVNEYAAKNSIDFFKKNVIMTVPMGYPGQGRKVYPGFLQLSSFLSMNLSTHAKKHVNFFQHLVAGDDTAADRHRHFYDEYMAVLDMTESFYLETLESVFMHHHLPQGKVIYKGDSVNLSAITDTALYTVEGGQDDICAVGQTKAAHALCTQLASDKQQYDLYPDVGHYGIFSGSKFRTEIAPRIGTFIAKHH